jgi:hypothetical protein
MNPTEGTTLAYRYATPSTMTGGQLALATSGGVTLSPGRYRGFSGEGGLLEALAAPGGTAEDAELIGLLLGWDPVIDLAALTAAAGLPPERVRTALAALAVSGAVGYDLADGAYFRRELPLGAAAERVSPRLAGARDLIATGQVTLTDGGARSGDHRVRFGQPQAPGGPPDDTCTCPWWGKYRGARGPCKHVLAASIALGATGTSAGAADRDAG